MSGVSSISLDRAFPMENEIPHHLDCPCYFSPREKGPSVVQGSAAGCPCQVVQWKVFPHPCCQIVSFFESSSHRQIFSKEISHKPSFVCRSALEGHPDGLADVGLLTGHQDHSLDGLPLIGGESGEGEQVIFENTALEPGQPGKRGLSPVLVDFSS